MGRDPYDYVSVLLFKGLLWVGCYSDITFHGNDCVVFKVILMWIVIVVD